MVNGLTVSTVLSTDSVLEIGTGGALSAFSSGIKCVTVLVTVESLIGSASFGANGVAGVTCETLSSVVPSLAQGVHRLAGQALLDKPVGAPRTDSVLPLGAAPVFIQA